MSELPLLSARGAAGRSAQGSPPTPAPAGAAVLRAEAE